MPTLRRPCPWRALFCDGHGAPRISRPGGGAARGPYLCAVLKGPEPQKKWMMHPFPRFPSGPFANPR